MTNFGKRFITWILIAACVVIAFVLRIAVSPLFMDALIFLISVAAILEVSNALKKKFAAPLYPVLFLHFALGYALIISGYHTAWLPLPSRYNTFLYIAVSMPFLFLATFILAFFIKRIKLENIIGTAFLFFYPTILLLLVASINNVKPDSLAQLGILTLFLTSFGSDTGAYLVGSSLKGPKLCPNLSPKKTVSGACGGLIGGIAGAFIVFGLYATGLIGSMPEFRDGADIPAYYFALIGVAGSVATQAGDLVASYVKRACGIKDFSGVFPGHGGFMDRLDGIIFNSVVIYVYLRTFLLGAG